MSGRRAVFRIERAGPLTTIQDAGRFGLMRHGVPESGPMDRIAYRTAMKLLGAPPGGTAIETSLGGLSLVCEEGPVRFAVTGGGFGVFLGGEAIGSWVAATARPGDRLEVRPGRWGSWAVLAFAGRIDCAPWLGSVATHNASGMGGRRLAGGERIAVVEAGELGLDDAPRGVPIPVPARPRSQVRVVLGPQDRFFAPETIAAFLSAEFRLSGDYDRMGVRLEGVRLPIAAALDMPSEAILRGSVQVPGSGDPVVLLADHQTTGGYPKIATVISADIDAFAQLRPRDRVAFEAVAPEAAVAAARARAIAVEGYLARIL